MAYVLSPRWLGLVLLVSLVWANLARAAVEYSVTDLGALLGPDRFFNVATGINASNQIAGWTMDQNDPNQDPSGVAEVYSNGIATTLPNLPAPYNYITTASAINNRGQVVGYGGTTFYFLPYPFAEHAFLYSGGSMTDLGTLGGSYSAASGINDNGEIVGESSISNTGSAVHAFLYSKGVMTDLGTFGGQSSTAAGINNQGVVVGNARTADGFVQAFSYSDGIMTDLGDLGGSDSEATAINDEGEIVGSSAFDSSNSGSHPFLYENGKMIDLGTLGGTNSEALAINDLGQIVGYSDTPTQQDAFLYNDGTLLDLNDLIDPVSGWDLLEAEGINDSGEIAATGGNINSPGQVDALLLTPLPEPSSTLLLLVAIVSSLTARRRVWRLAR